MNKLMMAALLSPALSFAALGGAGPTGGHSAGGLRAGIHHGRFPGAPFLAASRQTLPAQVTGRTFSRSLIAPTPNEVVNLPPGTHRQLGFPPEPRLSQPIFAQEWAQAPAFKGWPAWRHRDDRRGRRGHDENWRGEFFGQGPYGYNGYSAYPYGYSGYAYGPGGAWGDIDVLVSGLPEGYAGSPFGPGATIIVLPPSTSSALAEPEEPVVIDYPPGTRVLSAAPAPPAAAPAKPQGKSEPRSPAPQPAASEKNP